MSDAILITVMLVFFALVTGVCDRVIAFAVPFASGDGAERSAESGLAA